MPDIFDQLTADFPQQEGDIFDQIAPDSDESSSSRGASSISAPRSTVAAQNATSAGANPAAGSTAFAPQPSSQREMLGPRAAPGSDASKVAPAARAQGVSAQNNPPVRRPPAQRTIAPPVQQQKRVIQQPQTPPATKQTPAPASNTMQQPNWRYIAEHPELPEYRSLYQLALSHLSPEEKRDIVNKRIAAYPEKQKTIQQPVVTTAQWQASTGSQSGKQLTEPPSSKVQADTTQPSDWYSLAQHPEMGELYIRAWSHLTPEQKQEIVSKRIAAYPENQRIDPAVAIQILQMYYLGAIPEEQLPPQVLRFKRDVLGDNPNKNWMNWPGVRQALEADLKYVGDPYEEARRLWPKRPRA